MAKPLLIVLAALLLAVSTSGCGTTDSSANVAERKVKVTTTTNFITDIVRAVGGERVAVTGLMGPGVDPHLYKASARDVRTLRLADVIFYGGLELEGKMGHVFEKVGKRRPVFAVTRDIPREQLLEGVAANEEYDPHVWFDVGLYGSAVRLVRDELIAVDPRHKAVYERNARAYLDRLDRLDRWARGQLATIPQERRVLVTSHDAFRYLGRAYDVKVVGIQGISTAAEATTADVQRVAQTIARSGVKAVFVESSMPRQTVDAVLAASRRLGAEAKVGGELFSDAAGDEGTREGTYVGMVETNVDRIVKGLR